MGVRRVFDLRRLHLVVLVSGGEVSPIISLLSLWMFPPLAVGVDLVLPSSVLAPPTADLRDWKSFQPLRLEDLFLISRLEMGNGAGFFGFAARCQISSTASSRGSRFLRWSGGFASTVASEGSLLCILHRPFKIHQRSAGEVRHQGLPCPCFTDAQRGQSIWDHASVTPLVPLAGVPLFSGVDNGDSSAPERVIHRHLALRPNLARAWPWAALRPALGLVLARAWGLATPGSRGQSRPGRSGGRRWSMTGRSSRVDLARQRDLIFYNLIFFKKIYWIMGVSARTHSVEVTHLPVINLGSEVSSRAQQGILDGVDVAGTSAPEYIAPSSAPILTSSSAPQILAATSEPCILAPSMHSKPMAKFPLPRLLSFLSPPSRFLPLPNPSNLLNRRI
ncbi:uncharacterized protein [Miscanthus floridulus]|uniref:uncharacterized protein isoform X2 n=1 Tax=Miscanthus floridulus TaxID=154761 RepID=UPI0034574393